MQLWKLKNREITLGDFTVLYKPPLCKGRWAEERGSEGLFYTVNDGSCNNPSVSFAASSPYTGEPLFHSSSTLSFSMARFSNRLTCT